MRALTVAIIALAGVSTPAIAQPENVTDHVSFELDAQVLTDYDDSGLWVNGFGGGVNGLWALTASWHVGLRFGIDHWSFESESTVAGLVPPGAQVTFSQSTGQIDALSLSPMIRYEREEVFPARLGAFVQAGAGAVYQKTFALAEVKYSFGGPESVAKSEVDESNTEVQALAIAGITRPVSSSSWFEVLASYTTILADETVDVWGIGVGFRMRV